MNSLKEGFNFQPQQQNTLLALPMTPSHLLKAFLSLLYLGSADLDIQSLPSFLSLTQLLSIEAVIEPPAELSFQTEPSFTEKHLGEVGAALVAKQFAKVGLEIPRGIVFKEEGARSADQLHFPNKVVFKEGSLDSNIAKKKLVSDLQRLSKEKSLVKLQKLHFCNQCDFNTDSSKMFKSHNLYKHQVISARKGFSQMNIYKITFMQSTISQLTAVLHALSKPEQRDNL